MSSIFSPLLTQFIHPVPKKGLYTSAYVDEMGSIAMYLHQILLVDRAWDTSLQSINWARDSTKHVCIEIILDVEIWVSWIYFGCWTIMWNLRKSQMRREWNIGRQTWLISIGSVRENPPLLVWWSCVWSIVELPFVVGLSSSYPTDLLAAIRNNIDVPSGRAKPGWTITVSVSTGTCSYFRTTG